ncbi:MAG: glycosyltransferase, partial [Geminicoccaceae bacterium]|nr:glycosyltransferase [Geminicoccaceae bacterium]
MILTVYVLALLALASHPPELAAVPHGHAFAVVLSALTIWHVGRGISEFGRALAFRHHRFPVLRERAVDLDLQLVRPPHLYLVITSFEVRPETTARVFQAAIEAAMQFQVSTTLIACLAEPADQRLIKQAFRGLAPPEHLRLVLVPRPVGRLAAIAAGLRAVVRTRAPDEAAVMVMTGDTLLPITVFERSLPFLKLMPEVDLILTDQRGIGGRGLVDAWLELERAERHQRMSSTGIAQPLEPPGDGVLIMRAGILTSTRVIELIEAADARRGVRALEGGELIWLEMLRNDRGMLYLPDVSVVRMSDGTRRCSAARPPTRRGVPALIELIAQLSVLPPG